MQAAIKTTIRPVFTKEEQEIKRYFNRVVYRSRGKGLSNLSR